MKIYYAVLAIDSWHLANGIHQPNLYTSCSNKLDVCLDKIFERWDDLKDNKGNAINKEYVYSKLDNYLNIEIIEPREGWLRLEVINVDDYEDDCTKYSSIKNIVV